MRVNRRRVVGGFLGLLVALCPTAWGDVGFTFKKIADTNTPAPGGGGNFTGFGDPTYAAFTGNVAGGSGAYGFGNPITPSLVKLADTGTAVPDGSGSFASFNAPSGVGTRYVFRGTGGGGQEGIYVFNTADSTLKTIADHNTPIPGGTGNFTVFGPSPNLTLSSNRALFNGQGAGGQRGIYAKAPGAAGSVVADTNTVAPNSGGATFSAFGQDLGARGSQPVFRGTVGTQAGLYVAAGPLAVLVDHGTPVNGKGVNIASVSGAGVSGDNAGKAVVATIGGQIEGVFVASNFSSNSLDAAAVISGAVPNSAATFVDFRQVSSTMGTIEGGPMTVFSALNSDDSVGIYARFFNSSLERVIDTTMFLDGKQVSNVAMTNSSVVSYGVTFRAEFTDGSSGIYVAQANVPEPAAGVVVLAAAIPLLVGRARCRSANVAE